MPHDYVRPLDLLKQRKLDGIHAGEDPTSRLHIANQGGGNAGVVSLGMLDVIAGEGYLPHIDQIDVISAASMNGAAALAGKICLALNTYCEVLPSKNFVNLKRPWQIMDFGVLREAVSVLDCQAVVDNPTELAIGYTQAKDCSPTALTTSQIGAKDLIDYLMMAVHLPIAAGISRQPLVDGGSSWHTTPDISRYFGASHIIELANSPHKEWKLSEWPTNMVAAWMAIDGLNLANIARYRNFARSQVDIVNRGNSPDTQTIHPSENVLLPLTFTRDSETLRAGFKAGQNAACEALNVPLKHHALMSKPQKERRFADLPLPSPAASILRLAFSSF